MTTTARVDAWLWAVRVYKTRSAATTACRAGHVRVNGEKAKAAQTVKPGDEVRVRISGFDRMLVVRQTIVKRVGANVAAEAVEEEEMVLILLLELLEYMMEVQSEVQHGKVVMEEPVLLHTEQAEAEAVRLI